MHKERRKRREAGTSAKQSMQSLAARIPVIEATLVSRNQRLREQSATIVGLLQALRRGILEGSTTVDQTPGLKRAPLLESVDKVGGCRR